ncbi:unnamed protein product [Psylliodes chrysocephalus]|uniref:Uncharacterized protein n=1 Tax=Psylliodes chrysocephalus TaxID=3402493 RepID=A0A9P0CVW4_9CUCU|nr:unnamed protein product [Psylliodes chrysocephala]
MMIIEKLKMFSPRICLNQVRPTFTDLPIDTFCFNETILCHLEIQWRNLLNVSWIDFDVNDTIKFLTTVLNYENAIKEKPFYFLAKTVLGLLSIPVSNAGIVSNVFARSIKTPIFVLFSWIFFENTFNNIVSLITYRGSPHSSKFKKMPISLKRQEISVCRFDRSISYLLCRLVSWSQL